MKIRSKLQRYQNPGPVEPIEPLICQNSYGVLAVTYFYFLTKYSI